MAEITKLTSNSSKAEELSALKKMKAVAGEGTYLADLFPDKLINWAENQMKNDFPLDLYDQFLGSQESVNQLEHLVTNMKVEHEKEKKSWENERTAVYSRIDDDTEEFNRKLQSRDNTIAYWMRLNDETVKELKFQTESNQAKDVKLVILENEILRLKAALFDAGENYRRLEAGGNPPIIRL